MHLPSVRYLISIVLLSTCLGCVTMESKTGIPEVPYIFAPDVKGIYPGVIVLHTSAGLYKRDQHEIQYAKLLAKNGYVVAVVDYLYMGTSRNIWKAREILVNRDDVNGKIGMVGFSRGAAQGLEESQYMNKQNLPIHALVSFYGGSVYFLHKIKGSPPVLFLHGDKDDLYSPEQITDFCEKLKAIDTPCEMKIYPNVTHAFNQTYSDPGYIYSAKATEDSYNRSIEFLNEFLNNK